MLVFTQAEEKHQFTIREYEIPVAKTECLDAMATWRPGALGCFSLVQKMQAVSSTETCFTLL